MRKYNRLSILFSLLLCTGLYSYSQKDTSSIFFPENRVWPELFIDPLECQIMGGSYFLFKENSDMSLYSTVNLGFSKPVIGKRRGNVSWELNFGTAIFSQFDLIRKDDGTCLAGLINNDFKLSGDLTVEKNNNLLRIRTFHLSSHLGDDYLQRHSDTLTNDKSANYEQADLTFMRKYGSNYWYAGAGYIYTIHVFRDRFSLQGGGLIYFREEKPLSWFAGADIKSLAENEFYPDVRSAFGISVKRRSDPLIRIWAEYYTGRLPYSTIDYGRVNWIGLAMVLILR